MANIDFTRIVTAEDRARTADEAEARQTLAATDWMIIRQAETGDPVPEAVRQARSRARRILGGRS